MEGSCEYIELAVSDSRQGVVLNLITFTNLLDVTLSGNFPMFRRKVMPPSSLSKCKPNKQSASSKWKGKFNGISVERTVSVFRVDEYVR
jgi:hypothetical protein